MWGGWDVSLPLLLILSNPVLRLRNSWSLLSSCSKESFLRLSHWGNLHENGAQDLHQHCCCFGATGTDFCQETFYCSCNGSSVCYLFWFSARLHNRTVFTSRICHHHLNRPSDAGTFKVGTTVGFRTLNHIYKFWAYAKQPTQQLNTHRKMVTCIYIVGTSSKTGHGEKVAIRLWSASVSICLFHHSLIFGWVRQVFAECMDFLPFCVLSIWTKWEHSLDMSSNNNHSCSCIGIIIFAHIYSFYHQFSLSTSHSVDTHWLSRCKIWCNGVKRKIQLIVHNLVVNAVCRVWGSSPTSDHYSCIAKWCKIIAAHSVTFLPVHFYFYVFIRVWLFFLFFFVISKDSLT